MYHTLLLRRYLTTKILPHLAAAAVMLCTATVLIVWSIMGGFLSVLLFSGKTLVGDVIISWPVVGMGYYQELVSELEREPLVEAAAPMIETIGTLTLPDQRVQHVYVKGVDGPSYARVTGYADALWWRPMEKPLPKDRIGADIRVTNSTRLLGELPTRLEAMGVEITRLQDVPSRRARDPDAQAARERLKGLIATFPQVEKAAREALIAPEGSEERHAKSANALGLADKLGEELNNELTTLVATGDVETELVYAPSPPPLPPTAKPDAGKPEPQPRVGDRLLRFRQEIGESRRTLLTWGDVYANGLALTCPDEQTRLPVPAMALGIEVTNFNRRQPEGYYSPSATVFTREKNGDLRPIDAHVIGRALTLNVLPLDSRGRSIALVSRALPVANEFKTGIYDIDRTTVLVRLDALQQMLKMDEAHVVEQAPAGSGGIYDIEEGPDAARSNSAPPPPTPAEQARISPARVTTVLVRGKAGAELQDVLASCTTAYARFAAAHVGDVPDPVSIRISTWEQEQGTLIAAVKNEIVMMLIILGIISMTVSFLILAIFWAIVSEKTRDIGVLRAIGAGRAGVAGVWLGYGLAIGVIGSALGCAAACLIVWNINPIHDWLGRALGIIVWNPAVYYFSEIPNLVEPDKVLLVFVAGICFSVLGALLPAVKAARMDPVRALRFE